MDVRELILKELEKEGQVKASDIVRASGYSRAYVNRFFRELREEGVLVLIGKANRARYIPARKDLIMKEKAAIRSAHRLLRNKGLNEDEVLADIRKNTGIFMGLSNNVEKILEYGFTEMLNNAIEHSGSGKIEVRMEREKNNVFFEVRDWGVGIFNNIMSKKHLNSSMEAIQDLLKGKQTTEPASHSGEGIFFTSRVADILTIASSTKALVFDDLMEDVFVKSTRQDTSGTRVVFSIGTGSDKDLGSVFREYTDDAFVFSKTEVTIKLYAMGASYVSRSQARRLLAGLEEFKTVTLDFEGLDTIGQGFADEIFRVWNKKHPEIKIITKDAVENVEFMINRARSR